MPYLPTHLAQAWPAGIHRQQPDALRRLYAAWLDSPHPAHPDRKVAGGPVRRGLAKGETWAMDTQAGWQALEAVWASTPERVWVWSDLHLFHHNILRYADRPFPSALAMNDALLEAAWERVGADDWLLFLGDVSFGSPEDTAAWMSLLPGRRALLLGNHDVQRQPTLQTFEALGFEAVDATRDWAAPVGLVTASGQPIERLWLTHYPLHRGWIPDTVAQVHGHIHQHRLPGPYWNASVEQLGYAPQRLAHWLREPQAAPTTDEATAARIQA